MAVSFSETTVVFCTVNACCTNGPYSSFNKIHAIQNIKSGHAINSSVVDGNWNIEKTFHHKKHHCKVLFFNKFHRSLLILKKLTLLCFSSPFIWVQKVWTIGTNPAPMLIHACFVSELSTFWQALFLKCCTSGSSDVSCISQIGILVKATSHT